MAREEMNERLVLTAVIAACLCSVAAPRVMWVSRGPAFVPSGAFNRPGCLLLGASLLVGYGFARLSKRQRDWILFSAMIALLVADVAYSVIEHLDSDYFLLGLACLAVVASPALDPSTRLRRTLPWAAATSFAVALAFTRTPVPEAAPFAVSAAVKRANGASQQLTVSVEVTVRGCKRTDVTAVISAQPADAPGTSTAARYVYGAPQHFQHVDAETMTLTGDVFAPHASGAFRRCYLRLPQLVGPDADRLRRSVVRDAVPVTRGEITVSAPEDDVAVVRGVAPNQEGEPSEWTCTTRRPIDTEKQPLGCRGVLAITRRSQDALQDMLLILIGALFSITAEVARRQDPVHS